MKSHLLFQSLAAISFCHCLRRLCSGHPALQPRQRQVLHLGHELHFTEYL